MLKRKISGLLVIAMLISLFSGMLIVNAGSQIFKDTYTQTYSSGTAPTVQSGTGTYSTLGTQWSVIADPNSSGNYVLRAYDTLAATTSNARRNITSRTDKFSVEFEYYQAQNNNNPTTSSSALINVLFTQTASTSNGVNTGIGSNVGAYDGSSYKSNLKVISNPTGRWIPVKYTIDKPNNTFQFWVDGSLITTTTSLDGVLDYKSAVTAFDTIYLVTPSTAQQTQAMDVYFRNIELYTGDTPPATINLTGPADKSAYTKSTAVSLSANVTRQKAGSMVEFFANNVSLGTATPNANGDCTYSWSPSTDGKYTIKARATQADDTTVDTSTRSYWINDDAKWYEYYQDFETTDTGSLPSEITLINPTATPYPEDIRQVEDYSGNKKLRLATPSTSYARGVKIPFGANYSSELITFEFDFVSKSGQYAGTDTGRGLAITTFGGSNTSNFTSTTINGSNILTKSGLQATTDFTAKTGINTRDDATHNIKIVMDGPNKKHTIIYDNDFTNAQYIDYRTFPSDTRTILDYFQLVATNSTGTTISYDFAIDNIKMYKGLPIVSGENKITEAYTRFYNVSSLLNGTGTIDVNGNVITPTFGLATTITAKTGIANGTQTAQKTLWLILAQYDSTNKLKTVTYNPVNVQAKNSQEVTTALTLVSPAAGDYVKKFLWNMSSNVMTPISIPSQINK